MNASIKKSVAVVALSALSALSASAFASTYNGSCTSTPKSSWMPEKEVRAKFEQQGYNVGRIKSTGTCYEVYTKNKDGKKAELFVNPADGSVVKEAGKL